MNFDTLAEKLEERIRLVCRKQARYRVLWLIGKPRSGKTLLSRAVCKCNGWRYINYTLEPGFLDNLVGLEEIYSSEDFLGTLRLVCNDTSPEIIVLDEIEPLLSWWTWQQQEVFFKQIGRATNLQTGVVIVTRKRTSHELGKILQEMADNHIFEIP